jgi:hypothetical protein
MRVAIPIGTNIETRNVAMSPRSVERNETRGALTEKKITLETREEVTLIATITEEMSHGTPETLEIRENRGTAEIREIAGIPVIIIREVPEIRITTTGEMKEKIGKTRKGTNVTMNAEVITMGGVRGMRRMS